MNNRKSRPATTLTSFYLLLIGTLSMAGLFPQESSAATRLQKVQVAIVSLTPYGGVPCPADPMKLANLTYKTNCSKDKGQFASFLNYLMAAAKDNKITSSEWGQIKNRKFNIKPVTAEMKTFKTTVTSALVPLGM